MIVIICNDYGRARAPAGSPAALARRQQQLYDRHDALEDACFSLRLAIEALRSCCTPQDSSGHLDDLEALSDIAAGLARDRDAVRETLARLEAAEHAALKREAQRDAL